MKNFIQEYQHVFPILLFLACSPAIANEAPPNQENLVHDSGNDKEAAQGWSLDLGGQYTWMSLTIPTKYSGSTGGAQGKITYQKPGAFFGQVRSTYNFGKLSSSQNSARMRESYTEFVGGYCFSINTHWTFTPYAGIGFDFIQDNRSAYSTIAAIKLRYQLYYALAGLDTRYSWQNYYLGLQLNCFPTFNQYLRIKGFSGTAWTLQRKAGVDVRIPVGFKLAKNTWFEVAPYYRFLPIGSSKALELPHRYFDQWGAFATFRFFL